MPWKRAIKVSLVMLQKVANKQKMRASHHNVHANAPVKHYAYWVIFYVHQDNFHSIFLIHALSTVSCWTTIYCNNIQATYRRWKKPKSLEWVLPSLQIKLFLFTAVTIKDNNLHLFVSQLQSEFVLLSRGCSVQRSLPCGMSESPGSPSQ